MAEIKYLSKSGLETLADILATKSWVEGKNYTTASGHNHDDRYYTETEVNNLLANKANSSHGTHVPGIKSATGVSTLGWSTNSNYVPDLSMLAYWNGAYTGTSSNLAYSANGTIIGSSNYTTYTVKKDGTGASGTWGINITGNAGTATKLATARTFNLSTGVTATAQSFDGSGNVVIPVTSIKESYLTWGGQNFSGTYGPIDAAMIPQLGANRFAFMPAESITVEYSTNGGSKWSTYNVNNDAKINLFNGNGTSLYIGASSATKIDKSKYMLRITIATSAASVYTVLNKFIIYCSTSGSSGAYCTIDARLQSNYTAGTNTWVTFADKVPISGWSGYNVINTDGLTTYGNTAGSQYGQVRFTFGVTSHASSVTYPGLTINKIFGFGGVGWTTPSTMASTGQMYTYDASKNVTFPAKVNATTFEGSLTGTASTATNLTNTPELLISNNTIAVKAGEKTSSYITVPFATSATNADKVDGYHVNTGNKPFGTIPAIATDGVMEIGRYIDFHYDNTAGSDYSVRLQASGNNSNVITLPSGTGTLALTGHTHDGSTIINALSVGASPAQRNDYIVAQYAGGGTTTTSYHRRTLANIFAALNKSDITTALGYTPPTIDTASGKTFKTLTAKSASGWTNNTTDDKIIPTMSFIAYWNGAYSGTNSNLTYSANGTIIGTSNYTSYTVKKDGTGASGTWGINITGNAATATSSTVATNATNATNDPDGTSFKGNYLRKVTVANNVANDFNAFENMTLTGRGDPTSNCPALKNAPWTDKGPAGGYGVLTYLWSGYGTQMAWGYNSNRIYIRPKYYTNSASTWASTWDSLALVSDLSNYAAKSHGNHVPATGTANDAIYLRNDNTWQTITPAKIGAAAASHGTHVSGNAGFTSNSTSGVNCNDATSNGHWYWTSNGPSTSIGASYGDGALYTQAYSTSWVAQIAQDYRNGKIFTRSKNNGTWNEWKALSYDGHTHNYAPASHNHDDRYYTETEVNNLLAGKANSSHGTHVTDGAQTWSGNKTFNNQIILGSLNSSTSSSSNSQIVFGTSGAKLTSNGNGNIIMNPNSGTSGQIIFKPGSDPYIKVNGTNVSLDGHSHSSILDSGNSTKTTFAYSKSGLAYADYTWLAGWNGYELRAVNKSQFATASHSHKSLTYDDTATFGTYSMQYKQLSGDFDGNTGWCHYLTFNHGDGATYYHYNIGFPFWSVPIYKRQTGSTSDVTEWYKFITEENYTDFCSPVSHTHDDRYYTESEIDTKLAGKAASSHSHSYVPYGAVVFTPANTELTPENVLNLTGSWSMKKGTWDYAGNGYIKAGDFGNIDLAGTSILTFGNSSAYTQLYITAPTESSHSGKTNEIFFYNNHGSAYSPGWTRVLTNRNYNSYAPKKDGTGATGTWGINVTGSAGSVAWNNVTGKPSTFSPSAHDHTYIKAKDNYTFTSSTLPNSFDLGISAGFVQSDSADFPSYGSVLTCRTYSGGGGTLQLYAPYSSTYGGTRLRARFGNYAVSNGNSWTAMKEIAWLEDIPSSLPANGGSSTYAARLGDSSSYYTKASLDTALAGKANTHGHPYLPTAGGTMTGNITFDSNRSIRWHASDSYSISCPNTSSAAYMLIKGFEGTTINKRLSVYKTATSAPNTSYNLYTDGSLYAASAVIGGSTTIANGSDITLKASSSTSTDPGDLVFANSSGTELGRIWLNGSVFSLRYGSSDAAKTILTDANIGTYALTSLPSHTHSYLPLSGGTLTGTLTTTSGSSHAGIKVGDTYINAINGNLILQNNGAIRFGGDSWDYNVWAGLKYNHSNKTIYLGLADGTQFTANTGQSGGSVVLPGISTLKVGNTAVSLEGHTHSYASSSHGHSSLTCNYLLVNRSAVPNSGISFYSNSYNTWQIYMSDAGTTGVGTKGNITAPQGNIVKTWALRSVIENQANYGWTWEAMANNATTPSIVMELSSNTGALAVYGKVSASSGFFDSSDERLKDFYDDIDVDFDKLRSIPKKYFSWKADDKNEMQIGTSAQSIKEIYPELVSEDGNGNLSVAYNKLSVVALKAIDKLHDENIQLKEENEKLKEESEQLKTRLDVLEELLKSKGII